MIATENIRNGTSLERIAHDGTPNGGRRSDTREILHQDRAGVPFQRNGLVSVFVEKVSARGIQALKAAMQTALAILALFLLCVLVGAIDAGWLV